MRHHIIAVGGALVAALVLSACGQSAADGDLRLEVVATTTQVGSAAREIGGEEIDLTILLAPGVEAHDFELTPAAAAAVEDADLILKSGARLEAWLDEALVTIGGAERVRDMSEGIELSAPAAEAAGHDEAGHDEADGDENAAATDVDPHYWLSAPNARRMVENVRDALTGADQANADRFAERADVLLMRLEAADAEIRRLMDQIPPAQRGIVTNHDALGYFIEEYGLRFVGSVFPSLEVSSEPDPAQVAALIDTIEREQVKAVFSESAVNPELARMIADEGGARVVDEPLYTDSLGPAGSGAETLDGMLMHNARVIHDALVAR